MGCDGVTVEPVSIPVSLPLVPGICILDSSAGGAAYSIGLLFLQHG